MSLSSLSTSDLSVDKSTDAVGLAWQKAHHNVLSKCSLQQQMIIVSASSAEDLLRQLEQLQTSFGTRLATRGIKKIKPFIDAVSQYEHVLKAFSNAHLATVLLWGTFNLALTLSRRVADLQDKFINILVNLSDHLPRMQNYINTFSDRDRIREKLAAVYTEIMQLLILAVDFFGKKGLRFLFKFLWSDFEAETDRIVSRIEGHRQLLDLEANSYHISEAKSARASVHTHQEFLESVEVIKWLAPVEVDSYLERAQASLEPGTGLWFLASTEVQDWLMGRSQKLWVNGIPGAGKSTLCCGLITELLKSKPSRSTIYFFCDAGDSTRRSILSILRSLIAQLVAGKPHLVRTVRDEIIQSGERTTMSFKRLANQLRFLMRHQTTPIRAVIDGWDECEDIRSPALLDLFEELTRQDSFRVAIFSRQEPWIKRSLASWPELQVTSDKIRSDISLVADRATNRPPLSRLPDPTIAQRIVHTLVSEADGQFLWVRLMIEELERATYLSDIQKILANVPRGLGQLYARTLERLLKEPDHRQGAAHLLLKWLACSERHLTVRELSTALAIRVGADEMHPEDQIIDLRGFVEETCGSLVRFTQSSTESYSVTVSFVHLTVKAFLLEARELWAPTALSVSKFKVAATDANHYIASVCITYLTMDVFRREKEKEREKEENDKALALTVSQSHPFFDYAAVNWVRHLSRSGPPTIELLRQLHLFLSSDSLLVYVERHTSENVGSFSISNLLVSQTALNDWISQCNSQDPRTALVMDCFHRRLEETVHSRKEKLGAGHVDTMEAQYQLAQLLHFRGEWLRSATLHSEVLESRLQELGERDANTLDSMYQLAMVLRRSGKSKESLELHQRCLELRRDILGRDHMDTLRSEDGVAKTMNEQGRYDEAEALARTTLIRKHRVAGEGSLEAIKTMDNLAAILKDVGTRRSAEGDDLMAKQAWWECEALSQQCLSVREAQLGPENPETITCVNMLAIVLSRLHRFEESAVLHRRALQTRLKLFGPYNPHTQRSMRNLERVLRELGQLAEADALNRRYLESTAVDKHLVEREKNV